MQHTCKEVELAFSPDFAQNLLALAWGQFQSETAILQQMKAAVERKEVQAVFHLGQWTDEEK